MKNNTLNKMYNHIHKRKCHILMTQVALVNLHFRTSIDDIYRAFSPFGEITECRLMVNDRQESKGFAFVTYKNHMDATAAINNMNGFKMDGNNIVVSLSYQSTNRTDRTNEIPINQDRNTREQRYNDVRNRDPRFSNTRR